MAEKRINNRFDRKENGVHRIIKRQKRKHFLIYKKRPAFLQAGLWEVIKSANLSKVGKQRLCGCVGWNRVAGEANLGDVGAVW